MRRLIIGITGASGVIYGVRALEILAQVPEIETHLVISPAALRTAAAEEVGKTANEIRALASVVHNHKDIGASIASGSFRTAGMLVAPCSVKTLSGVANCYADDLITRAADVCLKERRPLVLMVRETPLHAGHIRLMDQATRSGAIVMPPVPGFYSLPRTIAEMVDQTVGRALDLFDIDLGTVRRWTEVNEPRETDKRGRGGVDERHQHRDPTTLRTGSNTGPNR